MFWFGLAGHLRVLRRLLCQGLHIGLHGVAQFLHQLGDLFIRCALFESVGEILLGIAQPLVGQRHVASLDAEGDFPEIARRVAQHVVIARQRHAAAGRLQQEEMRQVGDGLIRPHRQGRR